MSARVERVSGRLAVHPEGRLEAHAQLGDGSDFKAYGTGAVLALLAPVVAALDVAALEVDVRRLVGRRQRRLPRQHERVQSDGALRLSRVQLVNHLLQMAHRLDHQIGRVRLFGFVSSHCLDSSYTTLLLIEYKQLPVLWPSPRRSAIITWPHIDRSANHLLVNSFRFQPI